MNITQEILSDIVVYNKYAKYLPSKQRRETWKELVTRNKKMHQEKFPKLKEEIEDVYKWLYDNVDLFGDEEKQESAILIIKQGLVDHTLVSDPEINLAATMIRLARMK